MMGASISDMSIFSYLLVTFVVLLLIYFVIFINWHYWKSRGVPYLSPVLPIVGNMYDILGLRSLPDIVSRIYKETKHLPFVGIYAFHTPVLFVNSLDLLAHILVKDFSHFQDRGFHFNKNDLLGRNLIHQKGEDWKFSRAKLAPSFNIGKIKLMLQSILSKSETLVHQLMEEQVAKGSIETWDISLRYTTDLVSLFTIGIDPNSLQNKKSAFREVGRHILGFHFIYHIFTGCFLSRIHRLLNVSVAKNKVTKFFDSVVNQVITHRKSNVNAQNQKDVLQNLLSIKENYATTEKQIPDIDDRFVIAQSFIMFLAGHETPATILGCGLYEIAKQPLLQEKLIKEIQVSLSKFDNEITFEALQDMKYLRQVVAESMRKYTPLTLIFRRCTKDYTIPGTKTVIEAGTLILVPLRSIHEDPEYYPDPKAFDPDRFSDENNASRHIAGYMPFGIGPRNCPAVLYSHMVIRAALVNILLSYEVCLTEKTPPCLEANPKDFLFSPKHGIPLTFKKRQ